MIEKPVEFLNKFIQRSRAKVLIAKIFANQLLDFESFMSSLSRLNFVILFIT